MNLSSLDVNVDCDNTTLIQPPRVAPYNGTLVNNTSQLIISDEESSLGNSIESNNNNDTIKNINLEQDRLCITEFLSSFPDVSSFPLQRSYMDVFDNFFYFAVFDIQSDLGPDRLWSLPNDDQRTENGSVDDMWDFLFDYCQYCQRLPFRV